MTAPETWPQIRQRHEVEKLRAIHALMGGTIPQAAAALDISEASLSSFIYDRGLRWDRAVVEAAYPEITPKEAD